MLIFYNIIILITDVIKNRLIYKESWRFLCLCKKVGMTTFQFHKKQLQTHHPKAAEMLLSASKRIDLSKIRLLV
jgi:hypothetical protein